MNNSRITRAHEFAKSAHGKQERKFTKAPYISHLEETAQLLWEVTDGKADYDMYIAAILHDVVEDTDVTLAEVGQEFGQCVMVYVEELTIDEEAKAREGKKVYLARRLNEMSAPALLIKLCDRLSNVAGLENRAIPRDFVKWYVRETQYLIDNLERKRVNKMVEQLLDKMAKILVYLRIDRNING